tara:strand:+ start:208 stop:570 length:363 start_codon:yes stop_codon:yes gene_type:complete
MKAKVLNEDGQKAVVEMVSKETGLNIDHQAKQGRLIEESSAEYRNIPLKEMKLLKQPLHKLVSELEDIRSRHSTKNGGMRGIPSSVRNRIQRLETVINYKVDILQKAISENESGGTSEES